MAPFPMSPDDALARLWAWPYDCVDAKVAFGEDPLMDSVSGKVRAIGVHLGVALTGVPDVRIMDPFIEAARPEAEKLLALRRLVLDLQSYGIALAENATWWMMAALWHQMMEVLDNPPQQPHSKRASIKQHACTIEGRFGRHPGVVVVALAENLAKKNIRFRNGPWRAFQQAIRRCDREISRNPRLVAFWIAPDGSYQEMKRGRPAKYKVSPEKCAKVVPPKKTGETPKTEAPGDGMRSGTIHRN